MAWSPKTWLAGELVTAAMMNAEIRDLLNILKTFITDDGYPENLANVPPADGTGNGTTVETDITTFTIPAGLLDAVGKGFRLRCGIVLAANTNTKTVRIDVNGTKVSILVSSANVANNRAMIDLQFTRSTVTTMAITGITTMNVASGGSVTPIHIVAGAISPTANFGSASNTVKLTAQSNVAGNDLTFYGTTFTWIL